MIHRALDQDGDMRFGQGIASYGRDEQGIELNIRTRLLSWYGDCFFALSDGVDWASRLDTGQQANLEAEVKGNILQAFGVVGINTLSVDFDSTTRKIRIAYNIQTIFSPSFQSVVEQAIGAGV